MLGLPTKTYSPKHGKRSYQKDTKPSYAMPVRTHDSRTHDTGSRSGNSTQLVVVVGTAPVGSLC